jgi:hypothetical protein
MAEQASASTPGGGARAVAGGEDQPSLASSVGGSSPEMQMSGPATPDDPFATGGVSRTQVGDATPANAAAALAGLPGAGGVVPRQEPLYAAREHRQPVPQTQGATGLGARQGGGGGGAA